MVALLLLACGDKEPFFQRETGRWDSAPTQETGVEICQVPVPADARVVTGIDFNNDYRATLIACAGSDVTNNGPESTIYVATGALVKNYAAGAVLYVEGDATVQNTVGDATVTYAASADVGVVEAYRTATECPGLLLTENPCP